MPWKMQGSNKGGPGTCLSAYRNKNKSLYAFYALNMFNSPKQTSNFVKKNGCT